jgi:hypothetical protein
MNRVKLPILWRLIFIIEKIENTYYIVLQSPRGALRLLIVN